MNRSLAVLAAAVTVAAAPGSQGGDAPLTVSAVRFYSPSRGTTTIEGVCEVRLAQVFRTVGQRPRYRLEVVVLDSAGLELQRMDRDRLVPASAASQREATTLESFGFVAAPGRYRIRVRVTPEGGEPVEREVEVEGYRSAPAISDLLLATAARLAVSDSESPAPGEIRRGTLLLRTAPLPRLTPTEASLSYYAEVYPHGGAAGAGELRAEVVSGAGRTVVQTPPRAVEIGAAGAVTRGSLDLAGLPEGRYSLRLRIRHGDTTLVGEAPFAMASLAALAAQPAQAPAGPVDVFEGADEPRLDSLFGPLVYLAEAPREIGLYRNLSVEGKRRFLREFWQRRDPTPATPDNPARDEFYRAVVYANEAFRESGRGEIPGWNTDRGRVYLRNGRPDETLRRPAASPRPVEAWKYTRDRMRYYVFQDETGLGNYRLLGTNDRREINTTAWERLIGGDAYREVYQFLGLDPRNLGTDRNNP
jgi:GWxTD domain-containing protein